MEKQLRIIDTEWKLSKDGETKYLKVKTDDAEHPWKSCFESDIIEELKNNIGKVMQLEIVDSEDGKFSNIRGIVEMKVTRVLGGVNVGPTATSTSGEKVAIKQFNGDDKPSFYVSYAKDIFVALIDKSDIVPEETMKVAIQLVKQAREAFK